MEPARVIRRVLNGKSVVHAGYSRALFPLEKRVYCKDMLPGTQILIYLDLPDDVLLQDIRTLGSLLANRRVMNHGASIP